MDKHIEFKLKILFLPDFKIKNQIINFRFLKSKKYFKILWYFLIINNIYYIL